MIMAVREPGGCLPATVERVAEEERVFVPIVRQAVNDIHSPKKGLDKPIAMLRIHCAVQRSDEHRNAVRLHCLQSRDDAQEDLPDFAHGRLFVIQRIEQSKDHGGAGADGFQKRRQEVDHGLFHLIAREAA